jgi:superfamily II DNA or RNA helicase
MYQKLAHILRVNDKLLVTVDQKNTFELHCLAETFYYQQKTETGYNKIFLGELLTETIWAGSPGLFDRITAWLGKRHFKLEITDGRENRDADLERPDYGILYPLVAQRIMTSLSLDENGIYDFPTGSGKSRVIATLLDYIGTKKQGIIIGGSTNETEQLYKTLKTWCPQHKLALRTGRIKTPPARVTITTIESAKKLPEEMKNAEFFIGDEIHKSGRPTGIALLKQLTHKCAYKFGLTATLERIDNNDQWLEAEIGPVLARIEYQEAEENQIVVPINVWTYHTKCGGDLLWEGWDINLNTDLPLPIIEAMGIYKNKFLSAFLADIIQKELPKDLSTLICIEKRQQAELINHFLDTRHQAESIPLLHALLPKGAFFGLREGFKKRTPLKMFATKVLNVGYDYPELEAVVNGVGMLRKTDSIQRTGRAARIAKDKHEGILIEVIQNYNPMLKKLSHKRLELYRSYGWNIIEKEIPSPKYRAIEQPK